MITPTTYDLVKAEQAERFSSARMERRTLPIKGSPETTPARQWKRMTLRIPIPRSAFNR